MKITDNKRLKFLLKRLIPDSHFNYLIQDPLSWNTTDADIVKRIEELDKMIINMESKNERT